MLKITLDEAIKHCEEAAEENDLATGIYEILAENNHNAYEKLTAETNSSQCAKYAAYLRQLAEWLRELKERREAITKLSEQLSSVKRSVKSENSDYLTGYISALSAVEGMIAEMDGGAKNG